MTGPAGSHTVASCCDFHHAVMYVDQSCRLKAWYKDILACSPVSPAPALLRHAVIKQVEVHIVSLNCQTQLFHCMWPRLCLLSQALCQLTCCPAASQPGDR